MSDIKITAETKAYFDAIAQSGAYKWNNPGIEVPANVRVCMELMHVVLASGTISVSRQGGDLLSVTITDSGSSQIFNELEDALDEAIASHDGLNEQSGCCP